MKNAFHQISLGPITSARLSVTTPWGQVQPKSWRYVPCFDWATCCRCVRSTATIVTHATSSLPMNRGYIHVISWNRTSIDYYKLGEWNLGWCKTCIINREGMSRRAWCGVYGYTSKTQTCVPGWYLLSSKVFLMCISWVLSVAWFLFAMPN